MLNVRRTLTILGAWLALGAWLFAGLEMLEQRQAAEVALQAQEQEPPGMTVLERAVELRRAPDGHFHWPGSINGHPVEFLIDTGATRTVLPLQLATDLGLKLDGVVASRTAGGVVNGSFARTSIVLAGEVQIRSIRVAVLPQVHAPLLGMDVLSLLQWSQSGGVLRLEPRATH